jgi:hypothetical protein
LIVTAIKAKIDRLGNVNNNNNNDTAAGEDPLLCIKVKPV